MAYMKKLIYLLPLLLLSCEKEDINSYQQNNNIPTSNGHFIPDNAKIDTTNIDTIIWIDSFYKIEVITVDHDGDIFHEDYFRTNEVGIDTLHFITIETYTNWNKQRQKITILKSAKGLFLDKLDVNTKPNRRTIAYTQIYHLDYNTKQLTLGLDLNYKYREYTYYFPIQ